MIRKKSLLAGITALAVVLSSGIAAFAATDTPGLQVEKAGPARMVNLTDAQREAVQQARTDSMKEAVAELAGSGTITQDTADKLSVVRTIQKDGVGVCNRTDEQREAPQKAMGIKAGGNGAGSNLTEEQRTVLYDAMKEKLESKLAGLVDDGTLTQELADQILDQRGRPMGPGWKHGNRTE